MSGAAINRGHAAEKKRAAAVLAADVFLWCLLCALTVLGYINLGAVRQYSSVSLRYSAPVSGQAAYDARRYSIAHTKDSPFWPVFWKEYIATIKSEFITVKADCIAFSGEAAMVWPAGYITGAAPGVTDGVGCAVSEALAWRLWGSSDVVGMTLQVDETARVVRGVFEGSTEIALISFRDEDTSQSWNAVELTGGPEDPLREDAESFAATSGLGRPDSVLMPGPSTVAAALSILPLLILLCYALALLAGLVRKHFSSLSSPILFACIILFAAALPAILGILPAWLIPTRWSDFSFWASLLEQASGGMREFLRAAPMSRDVELRMLLSKQVVISFAAICCSLSVCFRWHLNSKNHRG